MPVHFDPFETALMDDHSQPDDCSPSAESRPPLTEHARREAETLANLLAAFEGDYNYPPGLLSRAAETIRDLLRRV